MIRDRVVVQPTGGRRASKGREMVEYERSHSKTEGDDANPVKLVSHRFSSWEGRVDLDVRVVIVEGDRHLRSALQRGLFLVR